MKTPILRQLAIAMTPDGLIGSGDKLLFTNPADLSNFALFTAHTVMIVGRKTAQQMIDMGVQFGKRRPVVVISEKGVLQNVPHETSKYVFYANSLIKALKMAEETSDRFDLNGYTVCGGKQVYEEFLDMLDKGKTRVNRAYMFAAEVGDIEIFDPVQLSRTYEQIRLTVVNRQVDSRAGVVPCDVGLRAEELTGDASLGEKVESKATLIRGKNCQFEWVTDFDDFDVTAAGVTEGRLKLKLTTGAVALRISEISHWEHRTGVNSVDIYMKNGQMIDARPATIAGLNWLEKVLNKVTPL